MAQPISLGNDFLKSPLESDQRAASLLNSDEAKAIEIVLKAVLEKMNEREATVLRMRFGLDNKVPKTQKEIGEILGLTCTHVRHIECVALDTLREHLLSLEPDSVPESVGRSVPADLQGKWIAWDEHQKTVLAAANTYPELLEIVEQSGLQDATIERAPGILAEVAAKTLDLLDGESSDILRDIEETIPDAKQWLDTPNTRLGFQKPQDLIGTSQENHLRYVLRGIWSGITS